MGSLFFPGSFMYISCKKMHSILPSTIYQLYIMVFPLLFVTFFPKNKRLFSTWESFSKTAILHACKSITLCKQAQKFGRLSSENLSSYLKTFFKRNGCLRYKRNSIFWALLSHFLPQTEIQSWFFHCLVNIRLSLMIRLLLKTRIHKLQFTNKPKILFLLFNFLLFVLISVLRFSRLFCQR